MRAYPDVGELIGTIGGLYQGSAGHVANGTGPQDEERRYPPLRKGIGKETELGRQAAGIISQALGEREFRREMLRESATGEDADRPGTAVVAAGNPHQPSICLKIADRERLDMRLFAGGRQCLLQLMEIDPAFPVVGGPYLEPIGLALDEADGRAAFHDQKHRIAAPRTGSQLDEGIGDLYLPVAFRTVYQAAEQAL